MVVFSDAVFGDWDGLEYDDCGVHSWGLSSFLASLVFAMSPPLSIVTDFDIREDQAVLS